MKLLHHTLARLSVLLIVILSVWAYLFYLNILDEIMDETDDTLENTKELIIKQSLRNGVVTGEHKDVMTHYSIREISPQEAENYKEHYFNSTRFYEVELEDDPVRVLKTSFKSKENRYYELTIMISTLEQDDMIDAMIQWIIILYVSLLITILIVTEIVFRKSLRPLHKLLKWLDSFTLGTNCKPLDNQTKIKEFKQLNTTIEKMTRRNEELYAQQRQFIENASHELQTPLAICQNKLEMLAEKTEGNEEMLQEIEEIQKNIGRSVKLNKSLLLLSRIENGQFHEEKEVCFNTLIRDTIEDFSEIYANKSIRTNVNEEAELIRPMNESLATTLITNLLKNAFLHSPEKSEIIISVTDNSIRFTNEDTDGPLDREKIFTRFYSGRKKTGSTGLGLSIIKSIATLYRIQVSYRYDGKHHFKLQWPRRNCS